MIVADATAPTWFHRALQQINRAFLAIRPDNAVKITGGTIDGTAIGGTTKAAGSFTALTATQSLTVPGTSVAVLTTATALTNAAGASVATLNNSPAAGDPAKWITINDAGVTRRIPTW